MFYSYVLHTCQEHQEKKKTHKQTNKNKAEMNKTMGQLEVVF